MKLRIRRILIAALISTVLTAVLITLSVPAIYLTYISSASTPYIFTRIQDLTLWTSPVLGLAICFLGGWWVARGMRDGSESNGLTFGVVSALLELVLLYSSGAPVGSLMAGSAVSRVTGGYAGGWWAGRRGIWIVAR